MIIKSIKGEHIHRNEILWISYDRTIGQPQYGDYGYLQCYAENREEVEINGIKYVKGKVSDIWWNGNGIRFRLTVDKYEVIIEEPERLFLDHYES